jgi:hypothetical protein
MRQPGLDRIHNCALLGSGQHAQMINNVGRILDLVWQVARLAHYAARMRAASARICRFASPESSFALSP